MRREKDAEVDSEKSTTRKSLTPDDLDVLTPQSDLSLPGRHFHIVTTAALPWFTGTSVTKSGLSSSSDSTAQQSKQHACAVKRGTDWKEEQYCKPSFNTGSTMGHPRGSMVGTPGGSARALWTSFR